MFWLDDERLAVKFHDFLADQTYLFQRLVRPVRERVEATIVYRREAVVIGDECAAQPDGPHFVIVEIGDRQDKDATLWEVVENSIEAKISQSWRRSLWFPAKGNAA